VSVTKTGQTFGTLPCVRTVSTPSGGGHRPWKGLQVPWIGWSEEPTTRPTTDRSPRWGGKSHHPNHTTRFQGCRREGKGVFCFPSPGHEVSGTKPLMTSLISPLTVKGQRDQIITNSYPSRPMIQIGHSRSLSLTRLVNITVTIITIPNSISFMTSILSTSVRLHIEFVHLLYWQTHRGTDRFFFNFRSSLCSIKQWTVPLPPLLVLLTVQV
jgi:hypothetical protein